VLPNTASADSAANRTSYTVCSNRWHLASATLLLIIRNAHCNWNNNLTLQWSVSTIGTRMVRHTPNTLIRCQSLITTVSKITSQQLKQAFSWMTRSTTKAVQIFWHIAWSLQLCPVGLSTPDFTPPLQQHKINDLERDENILTLECLILNMQDM